MIEEKEEKERRQCMLPEENVDVEGKAPLFDMKQVFA